MGLMVNGELRETGKRSSILALVQELGFETDSVAVACNGKFVPRTLWQSTIIQGDEQVEILSPMQGG
jgi:thiamine biosynthesis protein ThiS